MKGFFVYHRETVLLTLSKFIIIELLMFLLDTTFCFGRICVRQSHALLPADLRLPGFPRAPHGTLLAQTAVPALSGSLGLWRAMSCSLISTGLLRALLGNPVSSLEVYFLLSFPLSGLFA
jgi:hypothetical protein